MKYEVEMQAFQDGVIREVNVPDDELKPGDEEHNLELIFKYGQNDFQPVRGRCSVSVDDVIRYEGKRFGVVGVGFKLLAA